MRLERLDQIKLGDLVKCVCAMQRSDKPRGFWLGIVYDIDSNGTVHVRYDDGELCWYETDDELYGDDVYLLREERAHEQ